MEALSRHWSDIASLRSASAWLQWVSISLVFVSGFFQVGKFLVDRRERTLSAAVQAEQLNPASQPIRFATTTVEVVVESPAPMNNNFMDSGGYLAFGKAGQPIMILAAAQSSARQLGNNEVLWRGIFQMDANDSSAGRPVRFLRAAEFVQIAFGQLPKGSAVKRGKAVVLINNAVRLDIDIPAQKMVEERIVVPDVKQQLAPLE